MSREEWTELDNEAKQIKVATFCGWRRRYVNGKERWINIHDDRLIYHHYLPDYLGDLNAMHEAEHHMNSDQAERYEQLLAEIDVVDHCGHLWHARAEARAEAFVLTMEDRQ